MRLLAISILILISSCQEEEIVQNEPAEVCNCGEITNINQYFPNTYFTYTVANECTGNDTIVNDETYHDYGLNMCFQKQW